MKYLNLENPKKKSNFFRIHECGSTCHNLKGLKRKSCFLYLTPSGSKTIFINLHDTFYALFYYLEYTGIFRIYQDIQNIQGYSEYTEIFRIYREIQNIQGYSEYTGILRIYRDIQNIQGY